MLSSPICKKDNWPNAAMPISPTPMSFGRFRTSVVRQRLGIDIVFRIINTKVRTMDELGLPEHLKLLTRYQNGLILVTGSVGSGKSTTLAALVEQVNIERREHIITLEDPIEYVFEPKGCHITQREVHTHTLSFGRPCAARCAKIPMSSWWVKCAISKPFRSPSPLPKPVTLSSEHSTPATLRARSIGCSMSFPVDQQEQIRIMVSESLRGIISQQLVPRVRMDSAAFSRSKR